MDKIKDKKQENVTANDVAVMREECSRILYTLPKRENGTVSVRIFSDGQPYGRLSTKITSTKVETVVFEKEGERMKCSLLGMPLPDIRRTYEFLVDNEQLIKNEPLTGGVVLGYMEELIGSRVVSSESMQGTLFLVKAKEGHFEVRFSDYAEVVATLFSFENNEEGEKHLLSSIERLIQGVDILLTELPE